MDPLSKLLDVPGVHRVTASAMPGEAHHYHVEIDVAMKAESWVLLRQAFGPLLPANITITSVPPR